MMFISRRLLFTALGCGLIWMPAAGLLAQQSDPSPAANQPQTAPAASQDQEADPLNRQLSDKERYKAQKDLRQELKGPYKTWLNEEVPYIIYRRRAQSVPEPEQRRGARGVHRELLAAAQPQSRFPGERVPRRALPAHSVRQRSLCGRQAGMEDRPRAHLYHVGSAGHHRLPSFGRHVRAADGRGRRRDVDVPVRDLALPLSRGHRREHRPGVRGHLPVRRLPLHHRPQREGRAEERARRRPDAI